jgi:fructose-1,6-bisphosphatase/inositol monophosphatase family enzyme
VALVVRRAPVVGVVFNPVTEELYSAVRGRGAFCNDRPIRPSYVSEMTAACVATEFGAARDPRVVADKIRVMHAVVLAPVTPAPRAPRPAPRAAGWERASEARRARRCKRCGAWGRARSTCALWRRVRRQTSAAGAPRAARAPMADAARVAGHLDGYYEWGMHPWDVAAAWLVCSEAGAVATDLDGAPFGIAARRTLVAAPVCPAARATPLARSLACGAVAGTSWEAAGDAAGRRGPRGGRGTVGSARTGRVAKWRGGSMKLLRRCTFCYAYYGLFFLEVAKMRPSTPANTCST